MPFRAGAASRERGKDGGLLVPGSPLLTPQLTDTVVHLVVYLKPHSGDTVEKKMADTVPLFSEVDRDLEMDTLTVVGPDTARVGAWVVRVADPVIVERYVIDQASRGIVSMETSPRRGGIRMRYVPS